MHLAHNCTDRNLSTNSINILHDCFCRKSKISERVASYKYYRAIEAELVVWRCKHCCIISAVTLQMLSFSLFQEYVGAILTINIWLSLRPQILKLKHCAKRMYKNLFLINKLSYLQCHLLVMDKTCFYISSSIAANIAMQICCNTLEFLLLLNFCSFLLYAHKMKKKEIW